MASSELYLKRSAAQHGCTISLSHQQVLGILSLCWIPSQSDFICGAEPSKEVLSCQESFGIFPSLSNSHLSFPALFLLLGLIPNSELPRTTIAPC